MILLTVVVLLGVHAYSLTATAARADGEPVVIEVKKGSGFTLVVNKLEREGVIDDSRGIRLAALLKGAHKRIKAGEYELSASMTPLEILDTLVAGRIRQHRVTFPEGYNIREIADTLRADGVLYTEERYDEFIENVFNREYARSFGLEGDTLEGYLFPDTYHFTKKMDVDEIIGRMVARFKEVYTPEMIAAAEAAGLSIGQAVTLASIIQKEAGEVEEMPLISAVFHNRLKKGYRLQSDPTVIYGVELEGSFDGNLKRSHLRDATPYNTYTNYGLPPGPIASPGKRALRAAVYPAAEPYLYFVSRNDGTHKFSRTLVEHNKAVKRFQKDYFSRRPNG